MAALLDVFWFLPWLRSMLEYILLMPYRILCFFTGGGYYEEVWKKVFEILLREYTEKEREALKVSHLVIIWQGYSYEWNKGNSLCWTTYPVYSCFFLSFSLQVLSLAEEATVQEITQSYREQAKMWHPDHNPSKDAEAKFMRIHEAYEVLLRRYRPNRFK